MPDRPDLPLHPSLTLALFAASPWALPAVLAWWLPAPLWSRLALMSLIAFCALPTLLHQGCPGSPGSLRALHRQGSQLHVTLADGRVVEASVATHSRLWGGLLWLSLRHQDGHHNLLLSARQGMHNCPHEPLRQLTLWLRLATDPSSSQARAKYHPTEPDIRRNPHDS